MATPWRTLTLAPLDADLVRGLFEPLGDQVELIFPETRDRAGALAALREAELVIADFTGLHNVDAEVVEAAPHLAFVQRLASRMSLDVGPSVARSSTLLPEHDRPGGRP